MNCNNLQNILLKNLYPCYLLGIVCIKGSRDLCRKNGQQQLWWEEREGRGKFPRSHLLQLFKLVALSTGWSWHPLWKGDATLFLMD